MNINLLSGWPMFAPLLSLFSPRQLCRCSAEQSHPFRWLLSKLCCRVPAPARSLSNGGICITWQKIILNCMFPRIFSGWVDSARKMCNGMIESGPKTSLAPTSAIKLLLWLLLVVGVVSSEEYFRKHMLWLKFVDTLFYVISPFVL